MPAFVLHAMHITHSFLSKVDVLQVAQELVEPFVVRGCSPGAPKSLGRRLLMSPSPPSATERAPSARKKSRT